RLPGIEEFSCRPQQSNLQTKTLQTRDIAVPDLSRPELGFGRILTKPGLKHSRFPEQAITQLTCSPHPNDHGTRFPEILCRVSNVRRFSRAEVAQPVGSVSVAGIVIHSGGSKNRGFIPGTRMFAPR